MTRRPIRFATQLGALEASPGDDWIARVRRLEAIGFGTLAMPDHVVGQAWSPHPALAAVAATTGMRVGTLVIDNDFRNPLLTAREAATIDVLSNGRYELGLGAGWLDRDYLSLGIPFDRGRVRVERLAEAVALIKRLFTEGEVTFEGRYYSGLDLQRDRQPGRDRIAPEEAEPRAGHELLLPARAGYRAARSRRTGASRGALVTCFRPSGPAGRVLLGHVAAGANGERGPIS